MFMVCGEALMDVFADGTTPTGLTLDARIGGSPLNVAIGLARLGQPVGFLGGVSSGFMGHRLCLAMLEEGVHLSHVQRVDAPTTLGVVGLDAKGSASYAFYGQGCADRLLSIERLPLLDPSVKALHFGSFSMVVEPVASAQRFVIERERARCVIAYDPNLRLNVEPDVARWADAVSWMAQRAHLFKISAEDLELLRPGVPVIEVVRDWLGAGVGVVVVTRGAEGALGFTRRCSVRVEARAVPVVDTVGAGDSFQAALLAWLSENQLLSIDALMGLTQSQLEAALCFAIRAAAITCTRRGADVPRRTELS
jgi:fructokinase